MALKLSGVIDSLRLNLAWLEGQTGKKVFLQNTKASLFQDPYRRLATELRLVHRICSCVEMFFLQDSATKSVESEQDQSLESLFHRVGVAINEKAQEIYSVWEEITDGKLEYGRELWMRTLDPLLRKAVDRYMHSSPSKHCRIEELLEFIQLVSEDVKEIHSGSILLQNLEFLKIFIGFTASRGVGQDKLQDLLAHTEVLVTTVAYWSYLRWKTDVVDQTTWCAIRSNYYEMLEVQPAIREIYIRVLKASGSSCSSNYTRMDENIVGTFIDSLLETHRMLLASKSSFMVSVMKMLMEELRFLRYFIIYLRQKGGDLDEEMTNLICDVVSEAGIVIYSLSWDDLGEDSTTDAELGLSSWMEKVQLLNKEVAIKYPETSRYKFPSINEIGFMDGLLKDLKELIWYNPDSITFAQGQLDVVHEDLVFLRDFLCEMGKQHKEHEEIKALWFRVVDIAYRTEFVVNSLVVGEPSPDCRPTSFSTIKEEIKKIKTEVTEMHMENRYKIEALNTAKISDHLPSSGSNPTMDEVIVGFEDEAEKIIDRLRAKSAPLDIVSIVGMPGQGKTTLAKKVYNDSSIRSHFHVRAWCCISQGYQKRKLLLDILSDTTDGFSEKSNEELKQNLYKSLKGISEKSNEELEQILYKSLKGISEKSNEELEQILYKSLKGISEKSNEELEQILHKSLKGISERSNEELEQILYKSLKGRRYLIVLDDIWDIEAWRALRLSFPNDDNQSRILLTSRIHNVALQVKPNSNPHWLRLLNDAESRELLQKKLFHKKGYPAKLWNVGMQIAKRCKGLPLAVVTAAGILVKLEQDRWEDFAEGFSTALVSGTDQCTELLELSYIHLPDHLKPCLLYFGSFLQDQVIPVSRLIRMWTAEGFVQNATDKKSSENVAEDYLIDLINRSLVMVVKQTSRGGIKACSVHDLVQEFCVTKAREENFSHQLILRKGHAPLFEPHRLCIYPGRRYFREVRLCFRHLSTLIFIGDPPRIAYEVSSNFSNFKLLKVLDIRGIICCPFPADVTMLVHLRFLALVGQITSVPSTIVKLWNLETFLIKGSRGRISLPYTLLNMTKLRHLHVNDRVVFSSPGENLEKFPESRQLETFSNPLLSSGQDMVKIIRKFPYIRKLKCTFFGSWDSEEGYQFPALSFLSRLESLNVRSSGEIRYQLEFNFPLNLKKLTLSNFYLPWGLISRLAELPNLEVLKLLDKACEGEIWDMEAEEFTKLRFLKLENLDIVHWNACSENFPRLRQLVLHRCRKLQGIPSSVGEVTSLEIIEVKRCHRSVATSARILEEEIEGLKVFINVPDLDEESPEQGSWLNAVTM